MTVNMSKVQQSEFRFTHVFRKPVVRNTKITSEFLIVQVDAVVEVKCAGTPDAHPVADINGIYHAGNEVTAVIEYFNQLEEVQAAALKYYEHNPAAQRKEEVAA